MLQLFDFYTIKYHVATLAAVAKIQNYFRTREKNISSMAPSSRLPPLISLFLNYSLTFV